EGSCSPRSVAEGLAGWATREHRANARHVVVFHAGAAAPRLAETIAASDAFVAETERLTRGAPLPSRHHPLWPRMLAHHHLTMLEEPDPRRLAEITGDASQASSISGFDQSRARETLLGQAPRFRPWHPRWLDAR